MSLLADLLSKVKYQGHKGDIPPNLKQVVANSTDLKAITKKIVTLSVLILIAVITGLGAVYVLQTFIKPAAVKTTASLPQPAQPIQPQPAAPVLPVPSPRPSLPPSQAAAPEKTAPKKKLLSIRPPVPAISDEDEEAAEQPNHVEPRSLNGRARTDKTVKAEERETKQTVGESSDQRDMHLYAARTYESKKDYQKALSNYIKVLEFDPDNYIVANNISGILLMMDRYDDALHYAKIAIDLNKDYAPSLINAGIASIKLNYAAEGEKLLTKALTLEPLNRNAWLNLALLYEKTGEYDKANSSFYKLAELGGIQGYLGLARVAEKKGNSSDAARIYREILSMNNLDPGTRKMAGERLSLIDNR